MRAIFSGYLGWFSGNSAYLSPLTPSERAQRLAALAETDAPLLEQTGKAVRLGDYQWAVELADNLMRVKPCLKEAGLLKAEALMKHRLTRLAEEELRPLMSLPSFSPGTDPSLSSKICTITQAENLFIGAGTQR